MDEKALDYKLAYKISEVCGKINSIFKAQWKEDRKAYNKIKSIKDQISRGRERIYYYSIGGNELRPERAIEILEEFKGYANLMIPYVSQFSELENLKEEVDAIITAIKLIEHPPSVWNQFK
ncbi:hypothetical protein D3C71_848220 [compost metagenome]